VKLQLTLATTLLALGCAFMPPARAAEPRALRLNELAGALKFEPTLALSDAPGVAGSPMDLRRAIFQGLGASPDVRAAQFRADAFGHTRDAARGALLPRVELRAAVGRGWNEAQEPALKLPRKDGSAVLTQPLFDEGARYEWNRQGVLAASARSQVVGTESGAALEIAGAYLQALQARVAIEVGRQHETLLAELLRYITERAAGGGASAADRDRVRARVANARAGIADSRSALTVALRNLQRLVGEAPAAIEIGGVPRVALPADILGAKDMARERNEDLRAARADIEAADLERRTAIARFLPKVAVEVSHNRNVNAGGSASYLRDTKAMVVVTVPLLNGGTDYAQQRAVLAQREEKRARAEGVERRLLQEIDAAYANLDAVADRYRSVREELDANRAVVQAFQAQLTASNRSLLDVLDAYQRLYQSQLDLTALVVAEAQNHLKAAQLTGALAEALGAGWSAVEGR
jgi:adhesin transport system outer membrane protein